MVLWWIGNAILLLVVLPVVIFLLNRVLAAVERVRGATDDILSGGVALIGEPSRMSRSARSGTRVPSRSCSARADQNYRGEWLCQQPPGRR